MRMASIEICRLLLLTFRIHLILDNKQATSLSNNLHPQATTNSKQTPHTINPKTTQKVTSNRQSVSTQQNNHPPAILTSVQIIRATDMYQDSKLYQISFLIFVENQSFLLILLKFSIKIMSVIYILECIQPNCHPDLYPAIRKIDHQGKL